MYVIGKYENRKWAVLDTVTRVWYFASTPGKRAAQAYANTLNAEAR